MRKFLVYTLLLWLVLIWATMITVAVARTQPAPFLVRQLHLTACALPCWARITPGQTSANGAYRRLTALRADVYMEEELRLQGTYIFYERWVDGNPYALIWLWDNEQQLKHQAMIAMVIERGFVTGVSLPAPPFSNAFGASIGRFMPNLGEIIAVYGSPTCFVPSVVRGGIDRLTYKTPMGAIHIDMDNQSYDRISPKLSQPITLHFTNGKNDNTCNKPTARPWRGFASLSHYLREP